VIGIAKIEQVCNSANLFKTFFEKNARHIRQSLASAEKYFLSQTKKLRSQLPHYQTYCSDLFFLTAQKNAGKKKSR
jgi:hypothetical protein